MLIRILIILAALLCIPGPAAATGQRPDKMTYKGVVYPVHGFRLTDQMKGSLDNHRMTSRCSIIFSSANWDGFYAVLTLRDDKLHLMDLSTDWDKRPEKNCRPPTVEEAFGVVLPAEGLFADWFSGRLVSGYGECSDLSCSHYRLFHFEKGVLTKIEYQDREDFFNDLSRKRNQKDNMP